MSKAKRIARAAAGQVFRDGQLIPRETAGIGAKYPDVRDLAPDQVRDGMYVTLPGGGIGILHKEKEPAPSVLGEHVDIGEKDVATKSPGDSQPSHESAKPVLPANCDSGVDPPAPPIRE